MGFDSITRANINIKADEDLYKEISTLFFSHYESSTIAGHTIGLSWNPITPYAVREANRKGGNAGGWQEVSQNCKHNKTTSLPTTVLVVCFNDILTRHSQHSI